MRPTLIPIALAITAIPLTTLAQDVDPFATPKKGAARTAPVEGDPFAEQSGDSISREPRTIAEGLRFNIEVCYESFSLPLSEAAALQRMNLPDSELYTRIVTMVADEKAKQERLSVLRVRAGQKATAESIAEHIYPTEWEPPELPNVVGVQIVEDRGKDAPAQAPNLEKLSNSPNMVNATDNLRTPAMPTAFETRNVGHTLEVEPTLQEDFRTIEMRIAPENVTLAGELLHGQDLAETKSPQFEAQKLSLGVIVKSGMPHLLGTVSRPPMSKVDPDSANTTWFAFVTARPVVPQ